MKMQFANIKSFEYVVEFHDVHLYYNNDNDEQMEYLLCLNKDSPHILHKKYLMPIITKDFTQFVKDCLEYPTESMGKAEWEINIIQLIDKYNENLSTDILKFINVKLGSLILGNIKYKNFSYLKKVEKQLTTPYKFPTIDDNQNFTSQICWLMIMINNLLSVTKNKLVDLNYQTKSTQEINEIKTQNFDYLDWIFDYWS